MTPMEILAHFQGTRFGLARRPSPQEHGKRLCSICHSGCNRGRQERSRDHFKPAAEQFGKTKENVRWYGIRLTDVRWDIKVCPQIITGI